MTSHVRHRRSYDPAYIFPPIEPGELAVNTANLQVILGGGTTGTPHPLIAVRFFAATAQYAIGDLVVENGVLYRANAAIPPGPWNAAQWTLVSADVSVLVQKAGDTMTGPLLLAADPTAALQAATKQYVDAVGVTSWNGRKGAVTLAIADITTAGGAPLAAPAFTGTPTAPTAIAGTATGQLATTQFVGTAIAAVHPGGPSVPEAPDALHTYGRIGGTTPSWSPAMPVTGGTFSGPVTLAADPAAALQPATKQYTDAAIAGINIPTGQAVPTGTPLPWLTDTAPDGFLFANGQAVSRTTYAALFALFSTTFGVGNGTTTFNLPDMREVAVIGKSTMGGAAARGLIPQYTTTTVGAVVGEAQHTLVTAEMAAHTHTATATVTDPGHTHSYAHNAGGNADGTTPAQLYGTGATTGSSTTGITVAVANANTGGGGAHNNVQPSFVVNWIIKT